jgi:chromosomal replication initiation ATPase DnaA
MKKKIFNQYLALVLKMFGITMDELLTKSKKRQIVDAKQLLIYMCYRRQMRLVTIKEYLGDVGYVIDNKNVLHSIRAVDKKIEEDRDLQTIIRDIENSVFIN